MGLPTGISWPSRPLGLCAMSFPSRCRILHKTFFEQANCNYTLLSDSALLLVRMIIGTAEFIECLLSTWSHKALDS